MLFASALFAPGQRARLGWGRRVAAGAGIACTALLVAACNAQGGPSVVVTGAPNPAGASSTSAAVAARTTPRVYLAEGQDVRGRLLYRPACKPGCPLSGDSTAILNTMTWPTWSASKAVGTGTYDLDGCNPDCAAGPAYKVSVVVTLSKPVKVCSSAGTRWVWSRASFRFPHGLPRALRGSNAPLNPWVFSSVSSAARDSCAS
jgi:hypothetical protein